VIDHRVRIARKEEERERVRKKERKRDRKSTMGR
jgi:hypothetical protein